MIHKNALANLSGIPRIIPATYIEKKLFLPLILPTYTIPLTKNGFLRVYFTF